MKQAKTLSSLELKRVYAVIDAGTHSERNKIAFALSYYAGLRVKEIASLRMGDVLDSTGTAKQFVTLTAQQTMGSVGRTIVLNNKLRSVLIQKFEKIIALKNSINFFID